MRTILTLLFLLTILTSAKSQTTIRDFLPEGTVCSKNIPDPESYFGHIPGDRHLPWESVVAYAHELERISDRVVIEEYARSHENRPLIYMVFTSRKNHGRLEEIKKLRADFLSPGSTVKPGDIPVVVLLGYGVHGNESSATNSSVLTMYYLAAAEGAKIDSLLSNAIILVDPCLNPDGFSRHSSWVNMYQGRTDVSDPNHRNFNEAWPGSRTNHYWFDLNRDYLFMVHPESRGRIQKFHEWAPNIVTDHHEMGANNTFFFQPGIPSRNNPLVPEENFRLTLAISEYHRRVLDKRSELYYSRESFDDYYIGKGSSYPDINGSVGILFEQAGYRGKVRETARGIKTLASAIKNQFDVSLSTLEAAMQMKNTLLQSRKDFFSDALNQAQEGTVKGYLIGEPSDPAIWNRFIDILLEHRVEVFTIKDDVSYKGNLFKAASSAVIPMKQPQYRLIRSLFETATQFRDSSFYDVSTWTLPLAFGITVSEITQERELNQWKAEPVTRKETKVTVPEAGSDAYAWLFRWNDYHAPALLWEVQQAGIRTLVATREFQVQTSRGPDKFTYGTILIPAAGQKPSAKEIAATLTRLSRRHEIEIHPVVSGWAEEGSDLGSNYFIPLTQPKIIMLTGETTNSRDAGELWHMFDQRYRIPVTLADISMMGSINLNTYNTMILPGGSLRALTPAHTEKIRSWVSDGGNLIATGDANQWLADQKFISLKFKPQIPPDTSGTVLYSDREARAALNLIAGVIMQAEADITHPLGFGYNKTTIPVFKSGTRVAVSPSGQFTSPVRFSEKPYLSGYLSQKNLERISGAPVVTTFRSGNGRIINVMESFNFRGTWAITNKMFANAVFFGPAIR